MNSFVLHSVEVNCLDNYDLFVILKCVSFQVYIDTFFPYTIANEAGTIIINRNNQY